MNDEFFSRRKEILSRLEEFSKTKKKEDIFYELCFCLLTPQSNALKCWDAVEELKKRDFYNKNPDVVPILKNKTRFHNKKAKRLNELKGKFDVVYDRIKSLERDKIREYLYSNVKGIGWKEISHFLRNIGYRDFAILDRHVLNNLLKLGVIKEIPKTLTRKKYFEIEKKFQKFSEKKGVSMDELDLFFWSLETGKIFK